MEGAKQIEDYDTISPRESALQHIVSTPSRALRPHRECRNWSHFHTLVDLIFTRENYPRGRQSKLRQAQRTHDGSVSPPREGTSSCTCPGHKGATSSQLSPQEPGRCRRTTPPTGRSETMGFAHQPRRRRDQTMVGSRQA